MVSDIVSALGSVARTSKKPRHAPAQKKKKSKSQLDPLLGTSVSHAALRPSMQSIIRGPSTSTLFTLPFDVTITRLITNNGGVLNFGYATSGIYSLELDPGCFLTNVPSTVSHNPFGNPVALIATSFARYRFLNLNINYVSLVSSNTTGAITLAVVDDGGIKTTVAVDYETVGQCANSVTTPVWSSVRVPCQYNHDWLFTRDATPVSTSSERQQNAGTLMVSNATGLAPDAAFGIIRLSGRIQFSDVRTQGLPMYSTLTDTVVVPSPSLSLHPPTPGPPAGWFRP